MTFNKIKNCIKMTKLYTEDKFKHGQTNLIPHAGEVKISENGEIHVEDVHVDKIVALNIGWHKHDPKIAVEATTTTTTEVPEVTTTTTEKLKKKAHESEPLQSQLPEETTTTTTVEEVTTTTTTLSESTDTTTEDEKALMVASLGEMTVAHLQELAKPFVKTEWQSLKKAELIEYLKGKLFE